MLSGNTLLMKEVNKNLVRESLKLLRQATKQELSYKTGLSVVTVNSLLADMIKEGEVFEGGMIPSNGGRPSLQYCYNVNYSHGIVIFGHQKENKNCIHLAVVNLAGEIVYREETFMDKIMVESFEEMIDRGLKKVSTVSILGFGLPGEEEDGVVTINDYSGLIGKDFMAYYKEKYKIPVIFVNDVNGAVNGYYHYKATGGMKNIAGIYFPRLFEPGAGLVLGGEVYTGYKSFAGEIGKLPIGVDWLKLNYSAREEVAESIGRLVAAFSCIIAPEQFVLYGDFFREGDSYRINEYVRNLLGGKFDAYIVVSEQFEEDFEQGMIRFLLEQTDAKYILSRKGL
ncbi:ROK family protein [Anaerocolumna xylanovorans]|uniref:ROK family protein n=1 Tax=Anaerocolumna xylanovorans DSM 12503 TaxID=1121345 RepID=A0A1M7YDX6_9FIRM|nr:ROK family protein [Anaerocolumna xylanovorans]SHO50791.1 ROK family protein [Anaerocolumna xylanovorans DSM 12503]